MAEDFTRLSCRYLADGLVLRLGTCLVVGGGWVGHPLTGSGPLRQDAAKMCAVMHSGGLRNKRMHWIIEDTSYRSA